MPTNVPTLMSVLLSSVLCTSCTLGVRAPADALSLPAGIWQSPGCGYVLEVDADVQIFHVTPASCVRAERLDHNAFTAYFGEPQLKPPESESRSPAKQQFTLHRGPTRDVLHRLANLPQACQSPQWGDDPELNVEVFLSTFDSLYPFFDVRGIDWPELRQRTRATAKTDLQSALRECVETLSDGHVKVHAGESTIEVDPMFAPGTAPDGSAWTWKSLRRDLLEQLQAGGNAAPRHLELLANRRILYGEYEDGTIYLAILAMGGWDENQDEDTPVAMHVASAERRMDTLMTAISEAPGVVLDLRLNSGGFDAVAFALVARFADQGRVVFTRQAHPDAGPPYPVTLAPSKGARYRGPVAVLIGPYTVSAAEVAAQALSEQTKIKLFGQPTRGMLSDAIPKRLPNGWAFTLSVESLRTPEGTLLEGRGVQPDQHLAAAQHAQELWLPGIQHARDWLKQQIDAKPAG